MATERQILANRANAAKSTGPRTATGKRISSQNAALRLPGTPVLKGESLRRFHDLTTALTLQFQPRNSAETSLVHTMAVAQWHLVRIWGMQTAALEREMDRASQDHPSAAGAALAAIAFQRLADRSQAFALQHRLESAYARQFNSALGRILKLRKHLERAAEAAREEI
jgi:hypothetical protein